MVSIATKTAICLLANCLQPQPVDNLATHAEKARRGPTDRIGLAPMVPDLRHVDVARARDRGRGIVATVQDRRHADVVMARRRGLVEAMMMIVGTGLRITHGIDLRDDFKDHRHGLVTATAKGVAP